MIVAVTLGAWMLYLTLAVLIAVIPRWPEVGSMRYWIAIGVPVVFGTVASADTGQIGYGLAGAIATIMTYYLLEKKAGERT